MLMTSRIRAGLVATAVVVAALLAVVEFSVGGGIAGALGLRSNESPFVEAILEDGIVTEQELSLALNSAADCIEEQGIPVIRYGDPRLEGKIGFAANYDGKSDIEVARAVSDRCQAQYSRDVQLAYGAQNARTPKEADQLMLACLQSKGVKIDHPLRPGEATSLWENPDTRDAFVSCAENPIRK